MQKLHKQHTEEVQQEVSDLSLPLSCVFNFGKTPLAHPQNGCSTLFSNVSEADKAALEKLFYKYKGTKEKGKEKEKQK